MQSTTGPHLAPIPPRYPPARSIITSLGHCSTQDPSGRGVRMVSSSTNTAWLRLLSALFTVALVQRSRAPCCRRASASSARGVWQGGNRRHERVRGGSFRSVVPWHAGDKGAGAWLMNAGRPGVWKHKPPNMHAAQSTTDLQHQTAGIASKFMPGLELLLPKFCKRGPLNATPVVTATMAPLRLKNGITSFGSFACPGSRMGASRMRRCPLPPRVLSAYPVLSRFVISAVLYTCEGTVA